MPAHTRKESPRCKGARCARARCTTGVTDGALIGRWRQRLVAAGSLKRKLEKPEQRLARQPRQLGALSASFPGQRLWRICLSLGNIVSSRKPGELRRRDRTGWLMLQFERTRSWYRRSYGWRIPTVITTVITTAQQTNRLGHGKHVKGGCWRHQRENRCAGQ
jgi:hypothetical protein